LKSRYYNPELCRFISADSVVSGTGGVVLGYNLFAYSFNNPVNFDDVNGNWPKIIKNISKKVSSAISKVKNSVKTFISKKKSSNYNVPIYNQGDTSLCWAYCQTMVEAYRKNTNWTQAQADKRAKEIARKNLGDNWNNPWRPDNMGRGVSINKIEDLAKYLKSNGPLYARYYDTNDYNNGHLVVVTGVDLVSGHVFTNNPWGIKGIQTFSEFVDGFAGLEDTSTYQFDKIYLIN